MATKKRTKSSASKASKKKNPYSFFNGAGDGKIEETDIFASDTEDIAPKPTSTEENPFRFSSFVKSQHGGTGQSVKTKVPTPKKRTVAKRKQATPTAKKKRAAKSDDIFWDSEEDSFSDDAPPVTVLPQPQAAKLPEPSSTYFSDDSFSDDDTPSKEEFLKLQKRAEQAEARLKKVTNMLRLAKQKEKKDAEEMEAAVNLIGENLARTQSRVSTLKRENDTLKKQNTFLQGKVQTLQQQQQHQQRTVHQAQSTDVDWQNVRQHSQHCVNLLNKTVGDAKTSMRQLLQGVNNLNQIAATLNGINNIVEVKAQRPL